MYSGYLSNNKAFGDLKLYKNDTLGGYIFLLVPDNLDLDVSVFHFNEV